MLEKMEKEDDVTHCWQYICSERASLSLKSLVFVYVTLVKAHSLNHEKRCSITLVKYFS